MELLSSVMAGTLALFFLGSIGGSPQRGTPRERLPFDVVEAKSKAAKSSNEGSVRALIDSLFDYTLLHNLSEATRDRIFRADLGFHRGYHQPIREQTLVAAANYFAVRFGAPDYALTTVEQVRAFREITRRMVPHLGSENGIPRAVDLDLSPAEAVYIASSLARQKLFNPDYQIDASEWVQKHRDERARAARGDASPPIEARLRAAKAPKQIGELLWALEHDLSNSSSDISKGLEAFLDRIGLQR